MLVFDLTTEHANLIHSLRLDVPNNADIGNYTNQLAKLPCHRVATISTSTILQIWDPLLGTCLRTIRSKIPLEQTVNLPWWNEERLLTGAALQVWDYGISHDSNEINSTEKKDHEKKWLHFEVEHERFLAFSIVALKQKGCLALNRRDRLTLEIERLLNRFP